MSQPKIICRIHEVDKPFIYYFSHDDNFTSAAADEFNRNEQTGQHKHKVGPYVEHSAYDALAKENEELKANIDHDVCLNIVNDHKAEITSLRESLKLAVDALEKVDFNHEISSYLLIRQALATIKAKGEL